MKINHILKGSRISLPIIAREAGMDLGYLKQLSAGNASAGRETRDILASYLLRHSADLKEYAAQLRDNDPPEPDSLVR